MEQKIDIAVIGECLIELSANGSLAETSTLNKLQINFASINAANTFNISKIITVTPALAPKTLPALVPPKLWEP